MGVRIQHFGPPKTTQQDFVNSVFGGMDAGLNPIQPAEPMGNSIRQLLNQQLPGQPQQMQAFAPRPSRAVQAEMDRQEVDRMQKRYRTEGEREHLQRLLGSRPPEMPHVTNPAARSAYEKAHAMNLESHNRRLAGAQRRLDFLQ
jgi:hypothetical protein